GSGDAVGRKAAEAGGLAGVDGQSGEAGGGSEEVDGGILGGDDVAGGEVGVFVAVGIGGGPHAGLESGIDDGFSAAGAGAVHEELNFSAAAAFVPAEGDVVGASGEVEVGVAAVSEGGGGGIVVAASGALIDVVVDGEV